MPRTGSVALVTGAAGGIGEAVCRVLSAQSYDIAATDVRPMQVAASLRVELDLAALGGPEHLVDIVVGELGLPTVLVNCAGVYRAIDFPEVDLDYLDEVLAVNVRAPILLSAELAKRHLRQGTEAVIVNVASVSGEIGSPDAAYGASKGALIAFTRGAGRHLARQGIRMNAVAPGLIDTAMANNIPKARRDHYLEEIPAGRLGTVNEIANAVAFLASEHSSYMAGSVVDVNGGLA